MIIFEVISLTKFAGFRQSSKIALAMCLLICSVTACGFNKINQQEDTLMKKQADLESKLFEQGTVVYAKHDIHAGDVFRTSDLEVRPVQISRIPLDALTAVADAIKHQAKYDVPAGQVVSKFDLSN